MKAKLSARFYIIACVLLGMVALGWYGVKFILTNDVMLGDEPMDSGTKTVIALLIGVIVSSWTLSLFAMIRQIFIGHAFLMDEEGIHSTATASLVFSLLFVVPVKLIPYSAIRRVFEDDGVLTAEIDKSNLPVLPIFKLFIRREYHFFSKFAKTQEKEIKAALDKYMKGKD